MTTLIPRSFLAGLLLASATIVLGAPPTPIVDPPYLTGVIRDFREASVPGGHPDFEKPGDNAVVSGVVARELGPDGLPVFNDPGPAQYSGTDAFKQWFRDQPDINFPSPLRLELADGCPDGSTFVFRRNAFFPIDGQLFGNGGRLHNYHFTVHLQGVFTANGSEFIRAVADDDLWIFVNGRRVIDLGGRHSATAASVVLDAAALDILPGSTTNRFDLFFAERRTVESVLAIETNLKLHAPGTPEPIAALPDPALAPVQWNAASGSWHNPNNWSPPRVPGTNDLALLCNDGVIFVDAPAEVGGLIASRGVITHAAANTVGIDLIIRTFAHVGPSAAIDVSEAGYLGGARPGNTFGPVAQTLGDNGTTVQGANSGGGSHGNTGGSGSGNGYSNPVYGSATAPVHLGSGGGTLNSPGWWGGNGGGRIHIRTHHLIVDGALRANGGPSFHPDSGTYRRRGAGSGGSIFVELDGGDFGGSGVIEARGGPADETAFAGGDGRIAIVGFGSNGFAGTLGQAATVFTQPAGAGGHLRFDRSFLTIPTGAVASFASFSATTNGGTIYNYGTLAMSDDSLVLNPKLALVQQGVIKGANRPDDRIGSVTVRSNAVIWHAAGNTNGLQLHIADALTVEAGGAIDASESGYLGGSRPGNTFGPVGQTLGDNGTPAQGANSGGGSYGNSGGSGNGYSNPVYGSATAPVHLGSGGGTLNSPGWWGGNGGGRIHIRTHHLIVDGALRANGGPSFHPESGTYRRRGAGSGGSIFVELDGGDFAGSGVIEARGGPADETAFAGGDGRIAIVGFGSNGFAGTLGQAATVFTQPAGAGGHLRFDRSFLTIPTGAVASFASFSATTNGGTIYNYGTLAMSDDSLVLNPKLALVQQGVIKGANRPDDRIGSVTVRSNAVVVHAAGNTNGLQLHIADALTVEAGGAIDASESGYLGGSRPGNTFGPVGQTLGDNGTPAQGASSGGGSYGNSGGSGNGYSNPVYGSATAPVHLGSGGGTLNSPGWWGGNGGGRIHIRSHHLIVDGALRANGGPSFHPESGTYRRRAAGSGGSIFVELDGGDFVGSGVIEARGGPADETAFAGGDGRIAIVGFGSNGFAGTLGQAATVFTQPAGAGGHLRFDRSFLTIPTGAVASFASFSATTNGGTIYNYGTLAMSDDSLVLNPKLALVQQGVIKGANRPDDRIGSVTVRSNAVVVHAAGNTNGLQLHIADALTVEAGGAIDASESGYLGGSRPGNTFGPVAETLGNNGAPTQGADSGGGSYGSAGGSGGGTGHSNPIYGSATAPVHLGSGGGTLNSPGWWGGNGGGRIHIRSHHLIVDGALRANGGPSFHPESGTYRRRGAGSGGSIFVELDGGDFAGSGVIEARGGPADEAAFAGGCGRISISGHGIRSFNGTLDPCGSIYVNARPWFAPVADTSVPELSTVSVPNGATDADPDTQLTYTLLEAPAGATISPAGVITWPTGESDGPGIVTVTTRVVDNALAPLSATNTFRVTVTEVNAAPTLSTPTTIIVNAGQSILIPLEATDSDLPHNQLSFFLQDPPAGARITAANQFEWRPPVSAADTVHAIHLRVNDDGQPPLSDETTFTVVVRPLASTVQTVTTTASGQLKLVVEGTPGPDVVIMESTDLVQWIDRETYTSPAMPFEWTAPVQSDATQRFYRIRLQPE